MIRAGALLLVAIASCNGGDPPAPPLDGVDVRTGAPFSLREHAGRVVLVSFGYTSCVELCPDTFATAKTVLRALGGGVDFAYVTVDPARDDPASLRAFLAKVDPRFAGVFVPETRLPRTLADWHVTVRKRLPDPTKYAQGDYSLDHTAGFWGVDRRGRLRFHLGHDASDDEVIAATRKLVEEER